MEVDKMDFNESALQSRRATEETLRKRISPAIEVIAKQLKKEKDWDILPFNLLQSAFGECIKKSDRTMVIYSLQTHPNIIVRPSQTSHNTNGKISHTIPFEYKYITQKEKSKMGFDGIGVRFISTAQKKYIISKLQNIHYKSSPVDLMFLLNELITHGADTKWVEFNFFKKASIIGMPIDNLMKAFQDLHKAKLLFYYRLPKRKNGLDKNPHYSVRLAMDNNFDELEKLTKIHTQNYNQLTLKFKPRKAKTRVVKPKTKPKEEVITVLKSKKNNTKPQKQNTELQQLIKAVVESNNNLLKYLQANIKD